MDVSQRTFFRYFSSKEEVAFALQTLVSERFCEAVRRRPPGGSPVQVLRSTLGETWESVGEAIEEVVPLQLHMRMWQIIETTPALLAVASAALHGDGGAARPRSPAARAWTWTTDPRPRVLVAAFSGVMRAAGRCWSGGEDISVARPGMRSRPTWTSWAPRSVGLEHGAPAGADDSSRAATLSGHTTRAASSR